MRAFWDTDVWYYFHGHNDGRYGAAAPLVATPGDTIFIAVHRSEQDVSPPQMELLDIVRGPLGAALAFRAAWDGATRQLQESFAGQNPDDPLTTREAQVLALVEKGWTNQRIGHALALSERTVRKHLENVNAKLGVTNRTAAVARWRALSLG